MLDSERLELDDASVDGVLSRFGYVLKGDPPPALREVRRVLRPGGRFAFSVWAERERNPWMTVPAAVMVDLGHLEPRKPDRGDPFAVRSAEHTAKLLADAGFEETEIEELPMSYRFADADELWAFASELRGPIALAIETPRRCRPRRGPRRARGPGRAHAATAASPSAASASTRSRASADLTYHAPLRRLGRVVRQRPAKPFTAVRIC